MFFMYVYVCLSVCVCYVYVNVVMYVHICMYRLHIALWFLCLPSSTLLLEMEYLTESGTHWLASKLQNPPLSMVIIIRAPEKSLREFHKIPTVVTGDREKMALERMTCPPSWEISKLVPAASNHHQSVHSSLSLLCHAPQRLLFTVHYVSG